MLQGLVRKDSKPPAPKRIRDVLAIKDPAASSKVDERGGVLAYPTVFCDLGRLGKVTLPDVPDCKCVLPFNVNHSVG